jgi:hypothetical protein
MKEKTKQPLLKDPEAVRNLESQKYVSRNLQDAVDNRSDVNVFEWFEDNVIQKKASVEFRKDNGKDSAIIKMADPKIGKEEIVYSTSDETEVARLRLISEGKTVAIDVDEANKEKLRG